MFDRLKEQYKAGFVTKETLKTYVKIESLRPGRGITKKQYEEITGEKYKA